MNIHIKNLQVGNLFILPSNPYFRIWLHDNNQNISLKYGIPIFVLEAPTLIQKRSQAGKLNRYIMKIIYNSRIYDAYVINCDLDKRFVKLL